MPTRAHQAPRARTPADSGSGTSAFRPRPFGETAPSGPGPVPDFETQIERAGRFGHNLAHVSVSTPSPGEAPIQRESEAERLKREAREADKLKLKGVLNLVDQPDYLTGNPNDVMQQEFDEVAELYSRIREGDSHIKLVNKSKVDNDVNDNAMQEGAFNTFKQGALDDIAKILQTPQGRTVLKSLGAGGKTGTDDFTIGNAPNPHHAAHRTFDQTKGSDGTGSGAEVYFNPGTEVDSDLNPDSGPETLRSTSDTLLFHELLHAYHSGQGTKIPRNQTVFEEAANWEDIGVLKEEYATVGLGPHAGQFLTENEYRKSHREIARFNQPVADKYKHRKSYR
ncbi:MAG: M91 family zinc metallopeptidase [Thermoanaerobaculia bacterium]